MRCGELEKVGEEEPSFSLGHCAVTLFIFLPITPVRRVCEMQCSDGKKHLIYC